MKKLFCILILLILVVMAAIVPKQIHKSRLAYETRMVAVVAIIKKSFRTTSTDDPLTVTVFSPVVDFQNDGRLLSVSGVIELKSLSGRQHLDQFTARIRNECESRFDPECLRIESLNLTGKNAALAGELVYLLPTLPAQQNKPVQPNKQATAAASQSSAGAGTTDKTEKKPSQLEVKAKKAMEPNAEGKGKIESAATTPQKAPSVQQATAEPAEPPAPQAQKKEAALESKRVERLNVADANTQPTPQAAEEKTAAEAPEAPAASRPGSGQTELAAPFSKARPIEITDSPNRVLRVQLALKRFGYDPGPADNVVGEKTRSAILDYQRKNGLQPTGEPSMDLLKHLLSQISPSQAQSEAGSGGVTAAFGDGKRTETALLSTALTADRIAQIQLALQKFGYDTGQVDNMVGRKTRAAIIAYQRRNGLEPTGEPTQALLDHIRGITGQSGTP